MTIRTIAIEAQSERRGTFPKMAAQLRHRYGVACHLFVNSEEDRRFYADRSGDSFAEIHRTIDLLTPATPADDTETLRRAQDYEERLGVPLQHVVMSNRHLGRGFSPLGVGHPRSREADMVDRMETLRRVVAVLDFWETALTDGGYDAVVGSTKPLALTTRLLGLPYRQLMGARYKNHHYWAENEFGDSQAVASHFAALRRQNADSDERIDAPYKGIADVLRSYQDSVTLPKTLHRLGHRMAQQVYWRLRGYRKADNYYLSEDLRYIWRRRQHARQLLASDAVSLSALRGQKFVFFPLSTEPELSLTQLSPEFLFQQAALTAVARDLPADTVLAVKEHFVALGRRSPDFYRCVADLKNVVWLNVAEPGFNVIREAVGTVTINGTAGFEAAAMGKPVLAFGRHNVYRHLNHVENLESLHDLRGPLQRLTADRDAAQIAAAELEGRQLLRAVVETGFDARDFNLNKRDYAGDDFVTDMTGALMRDLAPSPSSAAVGA